LLGVRVKDTPSEGCPLCSTCFSSQGRETFKGVHEESAWVGFNAVFTLSLFGLADGGFDEALGVVPDHLPIGGFVLPIAADLEDPVEEPGLLRGRGASPGVAAGRVRVVETPEEAAAFCPGEVLVTTSPNPAWTPVYALASGLVTATGHVLSHGLVSAREYQLPAVIGVAEAARRLSTGQRVRVDGDRGIVRLE